MILPISPKQPIAIRIELRSLASAILEIFISSYNQFSIGIIDHHKIICNYFAADLVNFWSFTLISAINALSNTTSTIAQYIIIGTYDHTKQSKNCEIQIRFVITAQQSTTITHRFCNIWYDQLQNWTSRPIITYPKSKFIQADYNIIHLYLHQNIYHHR